MQVGEYAVTPSHELELLEFLKFNGFKHNSRLDNNPSNREYVIVVNVVKRFYFIADRFFIYPHIVEEEFYRKINHYPKENIEFKKLFDDEGRLLYEGYTLNDHPYGLGKLYFDNGNIYQDGVFDIKGIKLGKEHYYSGQVKFEGSWSITMGYGPNAPRQGNVYDENGEMTFTGKFEIKKGGVGWPMIKHPTGYRNNEKNKPDIDYINYSDLVRDDDGKLFEEAGVVLDEIQKFSLFDLRSSREQIIREINYYERYEIHDKFKTRRSELLYLFNHLYLSEICRLIYEKIHEGEDE